MVNYTQEPEPKLWEVIGEIICLCGWFLGLTGVFMFLLYLLGIAKGIA